MGKLRSRQVHRGRGRLLSTPVPAAAGEQRDGHAAQQGPLLGMEPAALGRAVLAAVIAAICEEAGRVVTPGEVRAVIRALREEAEGGFRNVRSQGRR